MKFQTGSEKETRDIAARIAKTLKGGETLGLIGDLGAGKTAFVKGVAKALGITKTIVSPTFVVMKVYPIRAGTIKKFVHVDAYRLNNAESLIAIGLHDYIAASDTVVVIEWADQVKEILPKKSKLIYFKHLGENQRRIKA